MNDTTTDPKIRAKLDEVKEKLERRLVEIDPHRRLVDRPANYKVIGGQTFEITYKDVPAIDESEVLGVKKLVGGTCYCSVSPQTAETLTVRFVVPLTSLLE